MFDRTLFQAGETVRMKHFLRRHALDGLFNIGEGLPATVLLRHEGSGQRFEMPLAWAPDGSAASEWAIPKEAKLGVYGVFLREKAPAAKGARTAVGGYAEGDEEYAHMGRGDRYAGSFRVEEYRVPLMKGTVSLAGGPRVNAREVELDLFVSYLSGGGAGGAAVRLRTDVSPRAVGFAGYGDFVFSNGRVVEGISRREGDEADAWDEEGEGPAEGPAPEKSSVRTRDLVLDAHGALRTKVAGIARSPAARELVAELEYSDPNGEIQAVSTRVPLWPSRVLLGIKPDSWAASKEAFKFHVAALDLSGAPVKDAAVAVDLFQRKSYTHRKRLLGGVYAYEHTEEIVKIGALCKGATDELGLLACETKSPVSGNVILQASAADAEGNASFAHRDVWVAGKDDWWFDVSSQDRIDLLPEKKRYEPGETAVFQVRMPFREATALVTVEREGIADVYVRKLSGKSPVVEIPVKPYHAPNVYVSVLCVRGRAADAAPTATVDLGKPAFKLGIAGIDVGWKVHEMKVEVKPERGRLPRPGEGEGEGPRGAGRRRPAAEGDRGRRGGGGRGASRARPERELEPPRGDDAAALLRGEHVDGADAGRREAAFRPQKPAAGRRRGDDGQGRRAAGGPRALRDDPVLERARAAGRERGGGGRDPAQRLPDLLPDRRGGERRGGVLRHRGGVHPVHPGRHGAFGPSRDGARGRPVSRRLHRAQRLRQGDEGPGGRQGGAPGREGSPGPGRR